MLYLLSLLLVIWLPSAAWAHARLMSPPSRSSMWRLGFRTKKNFNDNALYCGGINVQWQKNGGKCGICGDPYNMPHPRDNEAGGKYGRGIVSRRYLSGQVMEATVEVTTNHRGYFEFKLCPNNNPRKEATQDCLDEHVLKEAHGIGTRYYIGDRGRGDITVKLQLPKGLTCSQCVFQWTYVAGNNWGMCADGVSRLGCGPQETFRGCADISIEKSSDVFNFRAIENEIRNRRRGSYSNKTRKQNLYKYSTDSNYPEYNYQISKYNRRNTTRHNFVDKKSHPQYNKYYYNKKNEYDLSSHHSPVNAEEFVGDKTLLKLKNLKNHDGRKRQKYRGYNEHGAYKASYLHFPSDKNYEDVNKFLEKGGHRTSLSSNRAQRGKKRYPNRRPERHSALSQMSSFIDHAQDDRDSQYFTIGGRRYKDFWYL